MISIPKNKLNIVLIGNPGVGKSTFLNGFLHEVKFQSGIALGKGLTTVCQRMVDHAGNVYIDTPGLSDIKLREKAAIEIKDALSSGGLFKIFFVITLEEGRIRPDDKTTMKLVLDSAPQIGSRYSIIINKLQEEILEILADDGEKAAFLTLLNEELPPTSAVFFNRYETTLSGKKNVIPQLSEGFFDFITSAPLIIIDPEQVASIRADQFEEIKRFLSEQIQKLQSENAEMRKAFEEQQRKYTQIQQDNILRERELRDRYGKELDEIKRNHENQMKSLRNQAPPSRPMPAPPAEKVGFFGSVGKVVGNVFDGAVETTVDVASKTAEVTGSVVSTGLGAVSTGVSATVGAVSTGVSATVGAVSTGVSAAVGAVGTGVSATVGAVSSGVRWAAGGVKSLFWY